MISWIQKYFQHHFRAIFAVLLAVIIISFVFTIGAAPGIGSGERRYVEREFFGHNLSTAEGQQRLMGDAMLSASLQGAVGLENEQLQQYAFSRAAALHLADKWNVPAATGTEIKDAIMKLRMFMGQNGEFDAKAYATFRENLKKNNRGATEADIARVLGDDIRAEKVNTLLGGPGYVHPREIKNQLERADTTWTIATATTDYEAFKPEIKPSDADLTKFFEDNAFRYEIPPRVVATYVEFPAAQFVPKVTVNEAEVRAFYDMNPARFPKASADGKPATTPANPDADFAAVRQQVQAALIQDRARQLAVKAASDLAVSVFESKVGNDQRLDALLSQRNLQQKALAPFTQEAGPAELGNSPDIATEAFKLNKAHFVSDAVATPNGAVVLFWKETQDARKPMLSEVRDRVASDYIENEKRKRFVELGKTAKSLVETRLKAGESFEKAVAAAGSSTGLKFDLKTSSPFTFRTRPQDLDFSVLGALDTLNQGEVSDMVLTPDKGILVFAADKKTPALTETSPQFTEMRTRMATTVARMAANSYISEMVDREMKRTEPKPE